MLARKAARVEGTRSGLNFVEIMALGSPLTNKHPSAMLYTRKEKGRSRTDKHPLGIAHANLGPCSSRRIPTVLVG